jgi:hypothetical protein
MVKAIKSTLFELLPMHRLPEGSILARLQHAVETARVLAGEANRGVSELNSRHDEVTSWLEGCDSENCTPAEFSEGQARAILIERSLERRKSEARQATNRFEEAGARFRDAYDRYAGLARELAALERSDEAASYEEAISIISPATRRRTAAARARHISEEDAEYAAEIERVRAKIIALVQPG